MNLRHCISENLRETGFDGLCNEARDCACDLDDLMHCKTPDPTLCMPGFKTVCDCGQCEYHIEASNRKLAEALKRVAQRRQRDVLVMRGIYAWLKATNAGGLIDTYPINSLTEALKKAIQG